MHQVRRSLFDRRALSNHVDPHPTPSNPVEACQSLSIPLARHHIPPNTDKSGRTLWIPVKLRQTQRTLSNPVSMNAGLNETAVPIRET